jgi:hypothetical protein
MSTAVINDVPDEVGKIMEPHSDEYLRENGLIREMMQQGEFACLVEVVKEPYSTFIVQWWCRKTDKEYEASADKLLDALASVLGQAHVDPKPWVTEEECAETAERCKIKIYIPDPEHPFRPRHLD